MAIIEAIPNVSEGRHDDVLHALVQAVELVDGASLLDHSADPSHNRSVFTIVGDADSIMTAVLNLYEVAVSRIDLRTHEGEHPRIGAIDVVPFVPIRDASMSDCVALARRVGEAVAERFAVPVFLYGDAATRPERHALESVRSGGFEELAQRMQSPAGTPDFGPARPHPTAGASAIGARGPLIAFNVNLATNDLDAAWAIARAIRERDGGLPCVKAIGVRLDHREIVQVSINLTDYTRTPLHQVVAAVEREAAAREIEVVESEIIGLIPLDVVLAAAAFSLRLRHFDRRQVLENRLNFEEPRLPYPTGGAH